MLITNEKLYEKMEEAITLLCGVVKTTLGPIGNNAIINNSLKMPYITNDGVTIAENIASDDKIINTILSIAKESSIKTNELVGDGTTTTLVLLEVLFKEGLNLVRKGVKPIIIKNELDRVLKISLDYLHNWRFKPNDAAMQKIACISSNDEKIGKDIYDAYSKIGSSKGIKIIDTNNDETNIIYYDGYIFDTNIASNYYFQNNKQIILSDALILIVDDYLDNIEVLSEIINDVVANSKNLVIFAKDYSEDFINNILIMYLENKINIVLLKNPLYGERQLIINKDLEVLSGGKIVGNYEQVSYKNLGRVSQIEINKDKTILKYAKNAKINNYIKEIEGYVKGVHDEFEESYHYERLAMFKNGLANILVGASTNVECLEKKMRYDDALGAIESAKEGVLPGGGVTLLKLSDVLVASDDGSEILKKALKEPFKQIMINAGLDETKILNEIINTNYQKVYNVKKATYENIEDTNVLDSLAVLKSTLINAVSIAGMLLTTSSLIINEENSNYEINKLEEM